MSDFDALQLLTPHGSVFTCYMCLLEAGRHAYARSDVPEIATDTHGEGIPVCMELFVEEYPRRRRAAGFRVSRRH
jgi:hypothetical protein